LEKPSPAGDTGNESVFFSCGSSRDAKQPLQLLRSPPDKTVRNLMLVSERALQDGKTSEAPKRVQRRTEAISTPN
jgi:hypothetical protein